MKIFKQHSDLEKLDRSDTAYPAVQVLLERLIGMDEWPDHPYNPDDHGFIVLLEPGDVDRELDEIEMPRLVDTMWDGANIVDGYYHIIYLGAGDYGIGFLAPVDAPWINGELRTLIEDILDPLPTDTQEKTS